MSVNCYDGKVKISGMINEQLIKDVLKTLSQLPQDKIQKINDHADHVL